ncbi:hypothetical protein ACJX0J_009413, partial [Zea mays]
PFLFLYGHLPILIGIVVASRRLFFLGLGNVDDGYILENSIYIYMFHFLLIIFYCLIGHCGIQGDLFGPLGTLPTWGHGTTLFGYGGFFLLLLALEGMGDYNGRGGGASHVCLLIGNQESFVIELWWQPGIPHEDELLDRFSTVFVFLGLEVGVGWVFWWGANMIMTLYLHYNAPLFPIISDRGLIKTCSIMTDEKTC